MSARRTVSGAPTGGRSVTARLVLVAVALSVMMPLAACGKKSNLETPPNSEYPKHYPAE